MNQIQVMLALYITPGVTNLLYSLYDPRFLNKCRKLFLFFKPFNSVAFWIWNLFQLILPGLIMFVLLALFYSQLLDSHIKLLMIGILWGFIFSLLSPITIKIPGGAEFSFPIMERIEHAALSRIAEEEQPKLRIFWESVQKELKKSSRLNEGLEVLIEELRIDSSIGRISTNTEQEEKYTLKCEDLIKEANSDAKVREIVALLQRYPGVLSAEILLKFGIDRTFLEQHFSKWQLRRLSKLSVMTKPRLG